MAVYTPLNVAFLTLTAAFVGGCASLITFDKSANSSRHITSRNLFRTESPFASMFRGFAVYLAFMAGVYVTTTAPFVNPTSDQYVRLAATLSFFGFIVGYDPTKFADFLKMLPTPAGRREE